MIIEVRIDNCRVFNNPVTLSAKADLRNKKFSFNVFHNAKFHILKSLAIYGPNNVGKTCVVQCIQDIKHVIDNTRPLSIVPNLFTKKSVCDLGITFMESGRVFSYDFKYDIRSREFIYERFAEHKMSTNNRNIVYFEKDADENKYFFRNNKEIENVLSLVGRSNILIYLIDTAKFKDLQWIKDVLVHFAEKIDIVNMNNIPLKKTIEVLKTKGSLQQKLVAFIKNADLDLDNFEYNKDVFKDIKVEFDVKGADSFNPEAALKAQNNLLEQFCLVSRHRGIDFPSVLIDSTGTKKIVAMASYVLEAIEKGRILVVDELDSSLHFKLTRAIVALFNNEINVAGQLIFTIHDISLLDCKRLFRKEQIWFIHKDRKNIWMYSLAEFKARNRGTRDTTDIVEHYKKGVYGAVPEPNLIKVLLEVGK